MPRISQKFKLKQTQATLDFVDVDANGDTRLFIDPRAIEKLDTDWGRWAHDLLREFFERVLAAVKDGRRADAMRLMAGLGEPNATHLGMSRGIARGSGLGPKLAGELYDRLRGSRVRQTGLLKHLEDTALLVEGVQIDRVSDITTNIIRESLVVYTKQQCELHDIPREQVGAGPIWDPETGEWQPEEYDMLPTTDTGVLLLVPKIIVRRRLDFDPGEYYNKYILRHLMDQEYANSTSDLVHTLKSGKKRVYINELKPKVMKEFESTKAAIIDVTVNNPKVLQNYRRDKKKAANQQKPLALEDFGPVNWTKLLKNVTSVPPGTAGATKYHRAVVALLTALFYPDLISPKEEAPIDQGRKRVDVRYTVSGERQTGIIAWLARNTAPMPFVYVECKNYSDDIGNEELDQLTGRFNLGKGGQVGFLVNRAFDDKDIFIERCRDAALKNRGYVLALDDDDLTALTTARAGDDEQSFFNLLAERYRRLVE
jgi:hypothetical protein